MTKPIEGVSERILSCAKEGFWKKDMRMHRFAQLRQKQRQPRVLFIPGSGTRKDCLALWWNRQQEAERWKF